MASSKKVAGPFVVAYGAEDYLLDLVIQQARGLKGRSVIYLDGSEVSDSEIVSVCEQRTLDDTPRAVVVDNAHKVKASKVLEQYITGRNLTNTSVLLFAIARSDKLPAVWQEAATLGRLKHFPALKPWETGKQESRISAEAKRQGVALESEVPGLILRIVGYDLRRIANELSKLKLLVGNRHVNRKDLALVLSQHGAPCNPWDVAEAAADKNKRKALNLLSRLFKTMGDSAAVPVTAALIKQAERLFLVSHLLGKGLDVKDVAERLGVHPYILQKSVVPRVKRFTTRELLDQMKRLCELDSLVKGPARSKRTHVELAVLSIAT